MGARGPEGNKREAFLKMKPVMLLGSVVLSKLQSLGIIPAPVSPIDTFWFFFRFLSVISP